MKKYRTLWFAMIIIAAFIGSCTKVQEGYISDVLIYRRSPQVVSSGVLTTSVLPELNGTSQPVYFYINGASDSLGNPTDMLTKELDVYTWTEPYDLATDTTVALINAKRAVSKMPVALLNDRSGQFSFTPASSAIPGGKYSLDVRMENIAGSKVFKDALKIDIQEIEYQRFRTDCNILNAQNQGGGYLSPSPGYTVKRIARKPTADKPNTISFKIVDKHGVPWNPKNGEIVKRGDRPHFAMFAPFAPQVNTDSSMVFVYPFAPFPIGTSDATYNGYDSFYRVLRQHVDIDGNVPSTGEECLPGEWSMNVTFGFRFFMEGDWEVTIHMNNVTRI